MSSLSAFGTTGREIQAKEAYDIRGWRTSDWVDNSSWTQENNAAAWLMFMVQKVGVVDLAGMVLEEKLWGCLCINGAASLIRR